MLSLFCQSPSPLLDRYSSIVACWHLMRGSQFIAVGELLPWCSQNGDAGLNQSVVNHLAVSCLEPDGGSRDQTGNTVQVHTWRGLDQHEGDGIGQEADTRWEDFRIAPEARLLPVEIC